MVTSVKVSDEAKRLLDLLQARVTLSTGRKIQLQELLDAVVQSSLKHESEVEEAVSKPRRRLTDEEIEGLLSVSFDWGTETDAEEIDDYVYGPGDREKDEAPK